MLKDRFNKASDAVKYGVLTGAVYATYVPFMLFMYSLRNRPLADVVPDLAAVAVFSLACATPYIRKAPIALSKIFTGRAGKTSSPSPEILADVNELRAHFSIYEGIKTYILEDESKKDNAFTDGDRIYLGRSLVESLTREELKFVIAHEMAHIKYKDASQFIILAAPLAKIMLFTLPLALGSVLIPAAAIFDAIKGREVDMMLVAPWAAAGPAIAGLAYFYAATMNTYSRVAERRADRKAVQMTGDPDNAISALNKIDSSGINKENAALKLLYSHPPVEERTALIAGMKTGAITAPAV